MDKNELKKILHEQFEPLKDAVQRKLAYLQSDNVFAMGGDELADAEKPATDNSLENAFSYFSASGPLPAYQEPRDSDNNAASRDMDKISERKHNIAARIAAMRGISLPGDYLSNK